MHSQSSILNGQSSIVVLSFMTLPLIILNIGVSIVAFGAFSRHDRPERFLFIPAAVAEGKNFLGMFLSNFSHADLSHLLFNMMTLFFFGPPVERDLGASGLLVIYLLAGVGSTMAVYVLKKSDPTYRSLGASGSIAGLLFASIVLDPSISIYFFFIPVPIPGPIFAVGYVLLSSFLAKRGGGRVSHEAHIGGALVGLILAGILSPGGFQPLLERMRDLFS
jgi:membrane associated rhomboid family serine protease